MASTGILNSAGYMASQRSGIGRTKSTESPQALDHVVRRVPEATVTLKQPLVKKFQEVSKADPVSRLELLLLAKKPQPAPVPEAEMSASQKVNKAIHFCTEWFQVQKALTTVSFLTSDNLAVAIYRLGCLQTFASRLRIAELKASNLVPRIFGQAMEQLDGMEPVSLVMLLEGCARLEYRPSNLELAKIAKLVQQNVYSMFARQLSLVLWTFSTLDYNPGPQALLSLEDAVSRQASELSSQGMALVLSGFQAAEHQLSDLTLTRLAIVVQRKLLLFKPSELAICLDALSAQNYQPTPTFTQAVRERNGGFAEVNITGLPSLEAGIPNLAVA